MAERNPYIEKLLKQRLEHYRLGVKCRRKWNRRRGIKYVVPIDDPIFARLWLKCCYYYAELSERTGQKYV